MLLGNMVSPAGRATGAPAFDVADLNWDGLWLPSYASSPWSGAASAGASSGRNLSEATNAPAAAGALNGNNFARFDGTNDLLKTATNATDFATTTNFSGASLCELVSCATNDSNPAFNDVLFFTTGAVRYGVHFRNSSGTYTARLAIDSSGTKEVTVTVPAVTWMLLQWRGNGTNIEIRLNDDTWQSATGGTISGLAFTLSVANLITFAEIDVAWLGLSKQFFSDSDFDDILDWTRTTFGLALT